MVFRFQRHALHDGPGIRTLVFFKGCPLRCLWCFNPESQDPRPEIIHYPGKCIGCDLCVKACPVPGAIEERGGRKAIDRDLCNRCGECARACLTGGMTTLGMDVDVDRVIEVVEKDRVFYARSGGGVTLSGGEVTLQEAFALKVLQSCREREIHTAIETCGYASWDTIERLLHCTDLVHYDLKGMDSERHRAFTGVPNERILENAVRTVRSGVRTIIRIPLIPGYTDAGSDLEDAARFIRTALQGIAGVHLLPYEQVGEAKYERLGRRYGLEGVAPPTEARLAEIAEIFAGQGLKIRVGG